MEKYFTIVSDGSCDLPEEIVKEKEIGEVHFLVSFDGKEYKKEGVEIRLEDFYGKMVAESNVFPLTAAPSPNDYYEVFKEKAKEGKYILFVKKILLKWVVLQMMSKQQFPDTFPTKTKHCSIQILHSSE